MDEKGETVSWRKFWYAAKAWTSAQLSPNEYRNLREKDEKDASERRLTNYFFGTNWQELPGRAKDRLRNADTIWNAQERLGWEAIFSDLRIATEDMLGHFLWQPLSASTSGGQDFPEFVNIAKKLDENTERPEIGLCVKVSYFSCFKRFLEQQNLAQGDIEFLTNNLPSAMSQLQYVRNLGEHQPTNPWQREKIRPYIDLFFGIGKRGILPELARIGRLLKRT